MFVSDEAEGAMDEAGLVAQLATRDRERLRGYRELLEFYRGAQWREPARRGERQLTLNYAKVLVEKVTSYLMADRLFVVDPEDDRPESLEAARRSEAALARIVEVNDLEALDFDTELDAAVLGDGAYKVTWDVEAGEVRISAPDVQGLWIWPRPDDPWRPATLANRTTLASGESAVEVWTETTFALVADGRVVRRGPNPYGFIPYVVFPNLRLPKQLWGVSDLAGILEPARELNRAMTQLSRLLELSGNPIAVLENVDRAEDIAIGPGAVWELPERARAYILDLLGSGGVGIHIDYLNALYRALHDLAETPRTAFGDNSRALAGVALEIELQPLLQKVARKRLLRSTVYRRRNAMALRLLEQFGGGSYAPYRSRVVWGAVTPRDASRQLADEQLAIASGLRSRRSAMVRLGTVDPDREFARWLEEERERSALAAQKGAEDGGA
jgi:hypothetical protein